MNKATLVAFNACCLMLIVDTMPPNLVPGLLLHVQGQLRALVLAFVGFVFLLNCQHLQLPRIGRLLEEIVELGEEEKQELLYCMGVPRGLLVENREATVEGDDASSSSSSEEEESDASSWCTEDETTTVTEETKGEDQEEAKSGTEATTRPNPESPSPSPSPSPSGPATPGLEQQTSPQQPPPPLGEESPMFFYLAAHRELGKGRERIRQLADQDEDDLINEIAAAVPSGGGGVGGRVVAGKVKVK